MASGLAAQDAPPAGCAPEPLLGAQLDHPTLIGPRARGELISYGPHAGYRRAPYVLETYVEDDSTGLPSFGPRNSELLDAYIA
jgi:hypothetical protein